MIYILLLPFNKVIYICVCVCVYIYIYVCVYIYPWRRERLPTPVFWPAEYHGPCSLGGRKELDVTERLSHTYTYICIYIKQILILKLDYNNNSNTLMALIIC